MDTWLFLQVVRCPQFDPVSGTRSMNNESTEDGLEVSPSVYTISPDKQLVPVRSRDTFFKRRKKGKIIIVIVAFVMASLMTSVVILAVLYSRLNRALDLCDNEHCVRIAASLKESMDTSIDPCDDFYGYACGRWSAEHPSLYSDNSWFSERADRVTMKIRDLLKQDLTGDDVPWAVLQAQKLYNSCTALDKIDLLGLKPLFRLLDQLNLPQTPAVITGKHGNVVKLMATARRVLATDIFFGAAIGPDPRNKSRNIIFLDTPSAGNPLPSYNSETEKKMKSIRARFEKLDDEQDEMKSGPVSAVKTYVAQVIRQVVSNGTASNCSLRGKISMANEEEIKIAADIIYDVIGIFDHTSQLEKNESLSDEDITDEDYVLIDDLQERTDRHVKELNSSLNPRKIWRPYIEELFKDVKDLDLSKDKVLIGNMAYLKDVAYIFDSTEDAALETAIWWSVVDIVVPHSSKVLRTLWENYLDEYFEIESVQQRSYYCAGMVNELMGMAVSWLFVDPDFHEGKGTRVVEMLEDIRSAFASLVAKADWMDRRTKLASLEKSRKMTYVIGHPNWLFDEGMIDDYYDGIDMRDETYLENMLTIVRLMSEAELQLLHVDNFMNESFWGAEPTDVNAVHTFIINHITVPAGILQFPFYELGLEALNYGAIGTILGHELTHGFDNSGRLYDANGDLRQWWSNATIHQYSTKIDCFVKHYSSYYVDEVDEYIDGKLTLDENIADNGGLREAVLAYKRWKSKHGQEPVLPGFTHLTHEQLLFLGFAHLWCEANTADSLLWQLQDTHCPGYVRLRGVLRNSQEFSDAWQCPLGSGMNPEKKCRLW